MKFYYRLVIWSVSTKKNSDDGHLGAQSSLYIATDLLCMVERFKAQELCRFSTFHYFFHHFILEWKGIKKRKERENKNKNRIETCERVESCATLSSAKGCVEKKLQSNNLLSCSYSRAYTRLTCWIMFTRWNPAKNWNFLFLYGNKWTVESHKKVHIFHHGFV